jgi:hypothetical protein
MKEFIIVFLIALAVSSLFNGWNPFANNTPVPAPAEQSAVTDPAFGGAAQAAGQASPQSNNGNTPSGNPL